MMPETIKNAVLQGQVRTVRTTEDGCPPRTSEDRGCLSSLSSRIVRTGRGQPKDSEDRVRTKSEDRVRTAKDSVLTRARVSIPKGIFKGTYRNALEFLLTGGEQSRRVRGDMNSKAQINLSQSGNSLPSGNCSCQTGLALSFA